MSLIIGGTNRMTGHCFICIHSVYKRLLGQERPYNEWENQIWAHHWYILLLILEHVEEETAGMFDVLRLEASVSTSLWAPQIEQVGTATHSLTYQGVSSRLRCLACGPRTSIIPCHNVPTPFLDVTLRRVVIGSRLWAAAVGGMKRRNLLACVRLPRK